MNTTPEIEEQTKPKKLKKAHLEYLDDLRLSGVTNMYGGGEFLKRRFGLNEKDASRILLYWMQTFSDRKK